MTALLEAREVVKRYGGVRAVDGVSFSLDRHQILGLIGPNGSGKTTLLGVLAGTHDPTGGTVLLEGRTVSGRGAHRTVHGGIARTFQTTRLFPTWTLRDALRLAGGERPRDRKGYGDKGHGDQAHSDQAHSDQAQAAVPELLGLTGLLDRPCASLTSAAQRLAMIAVALTTGPRVLLLDEPAVGMDSSEAGALAGAVRRIRTELDVGVVVVDHNMHFLMPLADTVIVMASGKVLATGTPAQVRADEAVIASYLGS